MNSPGKDLTASPRPDIRRFWGGIRFRLTLMFGGVSLILGITSTGLIEHLAARSMIALSGERTREISRSIANSISQSLIERLREITLMSRSPLLTSGDWTNPAVRTIIEAAKESYTPYAWMGVADTSGRVVIATGHLLEGKDVSQRPWFVHGRTGPFLGDVHQALLLEHYLQNADPDVPLRFIDFAAPIRDPEGQWLGIVATHANWNWVDAVISEGMSPENTAQDIEVLLVDQEGYVLYPIQGDGQLHSLGQRLPKSGYAILDWDNRRYLTAQTIVRAPGTDTLSWHIVVRQPVEVALGSVADLRYHMLLLGVFMSLLLVFLANRVAISFSQPLQKLAQVAYRIDHGEETFNFTVRPFKLRELNELVSSIRGMTATLFERKHALEQVNRSLEDRIRERTAQLREANLQLAALATTDGLTGVANRRRFDEILEQEWERAKRAGTPLSLLMIDIDFFKQYNDHYGHQTGDTCLREVGRLVRDSIHRAGDAVARYGGEEFAAVLPGTPEEGALSFARALCQSMHARALPHARSPVGVLTFSVGAASMIPKPTEDASLLIARADQALYQAKRNGRNQAWLWEDARASHAYNQSSPTDT
ncbi:diguanylate cyclase [Thiorhodococcus drewsii AZ1]|uniref:diguanylate cyclase n=1 Tax=Thiorhodococcus drewsii AZ1 TaxID=765913 RepID=G2E689_9GAMM|nr:sensor domain-containing diguanylate cyclase [Thiorhodococcus drewsii]EGV28437.1 diguanylate cyclase [Thiorhodococcus drewsii AZ1]